MYVKGKINTLASEAYSEPNQTSTMKLFGNKVNRAFS